MKTVLLATGSVTGRSGTDLYTRDLALALLRQNWRPVIYAPAQGALADELRRATIPVVRDLDDVSFTPDVIHGHHGFELVSAMLRFPDAPAVFVAHDALTWHSVPPRLARIRAYVAVDANCYDRIVYEHGVPPERTRILANAVDLARFARREPLPAKPRRALVFSNAAREYTFVAPIREACAERGIHVDVAGEGSGNAVDQPEAVLPQYDVVFAKARCALEAMATGNAVVLCDAKGMATLVSSDSVEHLRRMNFGARTLQRPVTARAVGEELDRYDAADAARVTDTIRAAAGVDLLAQQFVALYDDVLAEPVVADAAAEAREVSRYMNRVSLHINAQLAALRPAAHGVRKRILENRTLAPLLRLVYRFR